MNFVTLVTYIVGIYFASSAASFHVKHEVRHGQKINGIMQDLETTDTSREEMISEPPRVNERRQNTQSMGHNKHKLDAFPQESLMNLNNAEIKNNSLPDRQIKYINNNEKEDTSEETKDTFEDTPVIWITGDPEQKLSIQTYNSDDQQSGDGLTSGEFSELHVDLQRESNIQTPFAELNEDSSKELINIPEEIDEDLKYVLNSTYDRYMNGELQNETHRDNFFKKNLKGALLESDRETNNKDENHHGEFYNRAQSANQLLIHATKGINMTTLLSDIDKQRADEETTNQSKKRTVSEYHNKIIKYEQRANITDQFYSTHPLGNAEDLLNNSYVQENYFAVKEKIENVETNNTKLAEPCASFHCKRGKTCKSDGKGNPFCTCQDPDLCQPTNVNDQVCGTDNKTYNSDCHLFATKCQLEGTKEGNHLHLDYQGQCKYIPLCTDYELSHFPFRMRDWLKNVLIQLYERCLENPELLSEKQRNKVKKIYENEKRLQEGDHNIELLVKDFQKNYHMYVYPVHWQFNQLDQHSIDRMLTRSELSVLRAPLIPMEHCVTAFLQGCNINNDKHISLQEWCHCFGITDGDIDENLLF